MLYYIYYIYIYIYIYVCMYVCIYLYINNKDEITNIYVRIYI